VPDDPSVSQGEEKFLPVVAETHNHLLGAVDFQRISGRDAAWREAVSAGKMGKEKGRDTTDWADSVISFVRRTPA